MPSILAIIGWLVLILIIVAIVAVVLLQQTKKPSTGEGKKEDAVASTDLQASPSGAAAPPAADEGSTHGGLRRRPSAAVREASPNGGLTLETAPSSGETRRLSFRTNSPTSIGDGKGSSAAEARRSSLLMVTGSLGHASSPSPPSGSAPSSPKIRKIASGKGVSFFMENTATQGGSVPGSPPGMSALGLPAIVPAEDIPCRLDAAETAVFSEDGLLVLGGGPEDPLVRVFNKGVGTIGSLRFSLNIQKDLGKHDAPSALGFAIDEGKKSTLLLVGTRSERFVLAYKISKSLTTAPLLVISIETKHGGPMAGMAGFIPKEAVSFFDPGCFYATCGKGTREVKLWSGKGAALATVDCECWAVGLRLAPSGKHLAVLSSGGGPGAIVDIKKDKHHHLKFARSKSLLPIADPSVPTANVASPMVTSRRSLLSGDLALFQSSRRSLLSGDLALQAAQDVVFHPDGSASLACCRTDVAVSVAHVSAMVEGGVAWELEALLKPEALLLSAPTHAITLVPKAENRQTRVLVARGKNLFFLDSALGVVGVLEGRREDGDVLGVALSPKSDFAVVVAFGASVARLVNIP